MTGSALLFLLVVGQSRGHPLNAWVEGGECARNSCMYVDTAARNPEKSNFDSTTLDRPVANEKACGAVWGTF
jgi:hypothetical protein